MRLLALGQARALLYTLALGTGLRRGELSRLRWCDLDLARHSTMDLTMRVYTDVRLLDLRAAVDRLPLPTLTAPASAPNSGNAEPTEARA